MTTGTKDAKALRVVIWVILKLFWVCFVRALKNTCVKRDFFMRKKFCLCGGISEWMLGPEKEMLKEPDVGRRILREG